MSIKTDIAVMKIQVAEMHKELMGNGQTGLIKDFAKWKGGLKVIIWVVSIGMPLVTALAVYALTH